MNLGHTVCSDCSKLQLMGIFQVTTFRENINFLNSKTFEKMSCDKISYSGLVGTKCQKNVYFQ